METGRSRAPGLRAAKPMGTAAPVTPSTKPTTWTTPSTAISARSQSRPAARGRPLIDHGYSGTSTSRRIDDCLEPGSPDRRLIFRPRGSLGELGNTCLAVLGAERELCAIRAPCERRDRRGARLLCQNL